MAEAGGQLSDRGLRADRRSQHRGARRQGRGDRLVLPAALRLRRLLRGAARRRGQRLLAAGARGRAPDDAALPAGHPGARDRARDRRGGGRGRRLHAVLGHPGRDRPGAAGARPRRPGRDGDRDRAPLRLRLDRPLGPPRRGRAARHRRPRRGGHPHAGAAQGRRLPQPRALHGRRRRDGAVRAHLLPLAPRRAAGDRPGGAARRDRGLVAQVGGAVQLPGSLARPGGAIADHPEGADPRRDRGDRRGADHLAARGDRRRPQLGLPLLLGARRDLHALRAAEVGLPRRGARLAAVAAQGGGGHARADAAALRHRRRAAAARARAALAPGLRRQPAGPRRQPGAEAGSARRARRDDGLAARRADPPPRPARRRLAAAGQAGRVHGEVLVGARPRHLGDARAAAALHPLEGDVPGWRSTGRRRR